MKAMEEMWQMQMASLQVSLLINSMAELRACMHHILYCGMYNRNLRNSLRTVEKLIISYGFYIELPLHLIRYVDQVVLDCQSNWFEHVLGHFRLLAVYDDLLNKQGTANDH